MPRIRETANDHDVHGKPLRHCGAILGTRVTRDFRADLAEAIYSDHPCDDAASCDVGAALDQGFIYAAAFLLSGSTETPEVDKCIAAHRFNGTIPASFDTRKTGYEDASISTCTTDWDAWCAYHDEHGVKCSSCGTYNYDPAPGDTCGNCLAELPREEDAEEDDE